MRGHSRFAASTLVGGLVLLCTSAAGAQSVQPVAYMASIAPGSIQGIVQDEAGAPVVGAMVSALGAKTEITTTDRGGKFEMQTLPPGPYIVRAHMSGYVASRAQVIEVRPSSRTSSSIALRRVTAPSVVAAGVVPDAQPEPVAINNDGGGSTGDDDHSATAWRLRHARRSILKDATLPDAVLAEDSPSQPGYFNSSSLLDRAVGSARMAADLFASTPFSGQVNLLTTGWFDNPQQFFSSDSVAHGVAFLSVGAPAGSGADWSVQGALTQGDLASWIVAGSYTTRSPARHRYQLGMSYAIQRYDGGNPAAMHGVTDGSRNAGAMYGFDTVTLSPAMSLTYGARYARYDYLEDRGLISPRVALTVSPSEHFRFSTLVSSRALAPGAEEFLPPAAGSIWLPPQRTFAALDSNHPLTTERTTHLDLSVERDVAAASTLTFRVFHQHVSDQLVTMFGVDGPDTAAAELGHYFVGTAGNVDADGWSAGVRTSLAEHVHASVEYSLARARWNPADDIAYLVLVAPSAVRAETDRVHDIATSVEADVPDTATRVVVLYRLSNAFARPTAPSAGAAPVFDGRFDVQVHQSLPFMNFSNARWEMLIAVRNFFRDASPDQSLYDELLVVHPPKRLVGGLTLRF